MRLSLNIPVVIFLNLDGTEEVAVEEHGVDEVREVDGTQRGVSVIGLEECGNILEAVTSGIEKVAYHALLYDVGDVLHVVDSDVALVARVHELELFEGVYRDPVFRVDLGAEEAVSILDKDCTGDFLLFDCSHDCLGLGCRGLVENHYANVVESEAAELQPEQRVYIESLGMLAQYGEVYVVECVEVKAEYRLYAHKHPVTPGGEYARHRAGFSALVGCSRDYQAKIL